MKYEIIQTENYLLVVSDEEIKDNDWYLGLKLKVNKAENGIHHVANAHSKIKKIICHLPLNGAPYLDGVDVLPEIEDEIEKLAEESTVAFVSEHEPTEYYGHASLSEMKAEGLRNSTIPKKITNSAVRIEWVGKYEF